ncbi:MAG: DHH family phosphoesterase [Pseudomonadota bacterium]|uniref:DHH family phosphoesterase n=1 Tax=Candidatus Desulfatibia profunda TaxID=2841695 RepID=A0A8J6NTB8_9BACT|nr:DHH family phosphoesterase [Candidatus Desulfatibia profunda]MBL7180589.1 DHH family phosphoesterase [Desulfobacterales bacterium]
MPRSAAEKLHRFYDRFLNDDRVLILINADPDAIASAMAVKRLLWHKVASVTISNINVIERPDNLAMIRLLGLGLVHVKEIDPSRFNRCVIVDSQPKHNELFDAFAPDVIIDHHPETGVQAPYVDIRPKYGATASIMTEYLRAARIKPSAKLATGLFFAIKTDTSNFERQALIEDVRAFQFLYRHTNIHLARKIEQSEIRLDFLKFFASALANMRLRKGRVFAHLGPVVNPDICVLIADFFMKISSVNWSFVSGLYHHSLILIFRNDGVRKNAGKVAKESFGSFGPAGGHKSMARAEIPLESLKPLIDPQDEKKFTNWIIKKIEKRAGKK